MKIKYIVFYKTNEKFGQYVLEDKQGKVYHKCFYDWQLTDEHKEQIKTLNKANTTNV